MRATNSDLSKHTKKVQFTSSKNAVSAYIAILFLLFCQMKIKKKPAKRKKH